MIIVVLLGLYFFTVFFLVVMIISGYFFDYVLILVVMIGVVFCVRDPTILCGCLRVVWLGNLWVSCVDDNL